MQNNACKQWYSRNKHFRNLLSKKSKLKNTPLKTNTFSNDLFRLRHFKSFDSNLLQLKNLMKKVYLIQFPIKTSYKVCFQLHVMFIVFVAWSNFSFNINKKYLSTEQFSVNDIYLLRPASWEESLEASSFCCLQQ